MRGDWERGIQLTQMGLTFAVSQQDRASALANLCAGFAALKKYQRALEHCDQSIALVTDNWRTWQNRAAANLGLGKIEESLRDIQRGLQINPDSDRYRRRSRSRAIMKNSSRSACGTCWSREADVRLQPDLPATRATASVAAVPIPPMNARPSGARRHSRGVTPWNRRSARNSVERESNPTCFTMSSTASSCLATGARRQSCACVAGTRAASRRGCA